MAPGYRVLSLLDEESVLIEDDRLQWVPVRRRLGIGAFGTNALAELARAIELNPDMRRRAEEEADLASLRGLAGWPAAVE